MLSACASSPKQVGTLEEASVSYRQNRDYASLELISRSVHEGMERAELEGLLGEPDYSPVEGQVYYASDREGPLGEQASPDGVPLRATYGLVADYRNEIGELTPHLQRFSFGPIGE